MYMYIYIYIYIYINDNDDKSKARDRVKAMSVKDLKAHYISWMYKPTRSDSYPNQ